MQFTNVIKSELYKNFCRKSTCILLIPVLLSFLITLGFRTGAVSLSMTGNSSETLSCMDYLFMNWMVLSSSGIIGLLFLLFAVFQFSGEIERGQIKFFLLRSHSRAGVLFGKYFSTVIVSALSAAFAFAGTVFFYYMMIGSSSQGNGSFAASAGGLTTDGRPGIHRAEPYPILPVDRSVLPARSVLRTVCNLCALSGFPLRWKLYFRPGYDSLQTLPLLLGKSAASRKSVVRSSAPGTGQRAPDIGSYSHYFDFHSWRFNKTDIR